MDKYSGSSKQRRDLLKAETELLGDELPFEFGKLSQLRILKAACTFLKKEKHFTSFKNYMITSEVQDYIDRFVDFHETIRNDGVLGFISCFNLKGELIYLSESITDYLGFNAMDLLLNYDYIHELAHGCDKQFYDDLTDNSSEYINGNKFSFFSLLFASKVKRKQTSLSEYKLFKVTGHFDDSTQMFIASCVPVLSVSNRELLTAYNAECFTSIHNLDLKFSQLDDAAESLLDYNLKEDNMLNKSLYDFLSEESLLLVAERHRQILVTKNTKGHLDPVKLLNKNGYYVNCLLNMYYESTGFIICKYQIMNQNDVFKYTDYVYSFKRDWFLNYSPSVESKEEASDSEEQVNNMEDFYQEVHSNHFKRTIDDDFNFNSSEDEYTSKKIKTEYAPVVEQEISSQHLGLCRKSSAEVKINNIKELLLSEIEIFRNNSTFNSYSSIEEDFIMKSELEQINDICYVQLPNIYDPNCYKFYDQSDNNDDLYYQNDYCNTRELIKFDEDIKAEKMSDQFDFENVWLESLEELI